MLSEFQFDSQTWHVVNNQSYEVISGVHCDNYAIVGETEQDLAIIHVNSNARTPMQLVKQGEKTIEVYMHGNGKLIIEDLNGKTHEHFFDESLSGKYVEVAVGEKMQWIASNIGLQFAEICKPPYKDGRFETLVVNDENLV